jgi:hypothetical protein
MRVQPRQERPAKPCAQILGTAQTSTAAITPKACAAARANPRRAKSNAWGTEEGRDQWLLRSMSSHVWRARVFSTRCFCSLPTIYQGALPTRGARGTLDLGVRCPGRPVGEQFGRAHQRPAQRSRYLKHLRHPFANSCVGVISFQPPTRVPTASCRGYCAFAVSKTKLVTSQQTVHVCGQPATRIIFRRMDGRLAPGLAVVNH